MEEFDEWTSLFSSSMTQVVGLTGIASMLSGSKPSISGTFMLLVVGLLIEAGRRLFPWVYKRFQIQISVTAQFHEGDPAYDWIVLFLTTEKVWRRARDFQVTAKSSRRRWGIGSKIPNQISEDEHAEYVPTFASTLPQLFRWDGYWVESKSNRYGPYQVEHPITGEMSAGASIYLKIFTRDITVLSKFVETARLRYIEINKPHVIVHICDKPEYGSKSTWTDVKSKTRRRLDSIVLEDNVLEMLLSDAREFIAMEQWYKDSGIPHKRGYLLHGPPGTGKTSTIYALASELTMEIYTLSLASTFVDDSFLQRAVSTIPKKSIFIIEDIDCAFPSREEEEEERNKEFNYYGESKAKVTLSGLLNVLDGVGSEEGSLFFATTNYVDKLDAALVRPGRIDVKAEYKLATKAQAVALFIRFYPHKHVKLEDAVTSTESSSFTLPEKAETFDQAIDRLANTFAESVPEHEFTAAELQGYLLHYKLEPKKAVQNVVDWVSRERTLREEKEKREQERKEAKAKSKSKLDHNSYASDETGLGVCLPHSLLGVKLPVGDKPPAEGGEEKNSDAQILGPEPESIQPHLVWTLF